MSKKQTKIICLFGFMAVGKLTIGQKLHKKTNISFCHNHLLNDFITSIFPRGNKTRHELMEKYKIETCGRAVEEGLSLIITEAYASNFTSLTGTTSKQLIEQIAKEVAEKGGIFYGIHLLADEETILKRIPNNSRKRFMKLLDPIEAKELLLTAGEQISPDITYLLKIDTGKISPEESVEKIINFIK